MGKHNEETFVNGCGSHDDCFTCPFEECVFDPRYPNKKMEHCCRPIPTLVQFNSKKDYEYAYSRFVRARSREFFLKDKGLWDDKSEEKVWKTFDRAYFFLKITVEGEK